MLHPPMNEGASSQGGGTGLGLAIVKFIAEAHRGGVDVVSHRERGTTFMIMLPLTGTVQQQAGSVGAAMALP